MLDILPVSSAMAAASRYGFWMPKGVVRRLRVKKLDNIPKQH